MECCNVIRRQLLLSITEVSSGICGISPRENIQKRGEWGGGVIPISILQTHSFPLKYINSSALSPWQAPLISRQTKQISDMDLLLLLIVLPTQPDLFLGRVAHSTNSMPNIELRARTTKLALILPDTLSYQSPRPRP